MDLSLLTVLSSSISSAKELGKAAIGLRDFNEIAPVVSKLNDQLLKAQETMFNLQTQLMALQQENFERTQELRKVKEALAQRGRYALVEISDRVYVYRMNVAPGVSDVENPVSPEPLHHLCQSCFDKGVKSVLQKCVTHGAINLACLVCKGEFFTGKSEPFAF